MNIYTIYKATNLINGKCYIGFDSNWPNRMPRHKRNFNNISSKNNKSAFYDALRKYKWDNFTWEILYQSKDKHHTLNEMENYFIHEYESYGGFTNSNGYNMTLGGDGTVEKIQTSYKNYKFIDKNNKIIEIENLNAFRVENKLEISSMYRLANGNIKFYKNYRNINFPEHTPKKYKIYKFIKNHNATIEVINLKNFCGENSLTYSCMLDVYYGRQNSHKGYAKCQI